MADKIHDKVAEAVAERAGRAVYEYDVPEKVANGITKVALVKLTAREEMMATARARNDAIRLAYELAKASLVEINGEVLNKTDGDADIQWERMDPQVRDLVMSAYGDLHNTDKETTDSFLESRRVRAS